MKILVIFGLGMGPATGPPTTRQGNPCMKRRLCKVTFSSASDPSKLNTAYLFFSFFPSSFEAGKIIARYGPSTSKKMEFSLRTEYFSALASSSSWYWSLVNRSYHEQMETFPSFALYYSVMVFFCMYRLLNFKKNYFRLEKNQSQC